MTVLRNENLVELGTKEVDSVPVAADRYGRLLRSGVGAGGASDGYGSPVTVTRPANVTAYTAGDVVGGAIDLGVMGPNAGQVLITGGTLEIDVAAVPAGMTYFRLALYNVTPPSALADNAAFDIPAGDRASFLGFYTLQTPVDEGSTLWVEVNTQKQVLLAGTHLFAYLVTATGYTPAANSEVYKVGLKAVAV